MMMIFSDTFSNTISLKPPTAWGILYIPHAFWTQVSGTSYITSSVLVWMLQILHRTSNRTGGYT